MTSAYHDDDDSARRRPTGAPSPKPATNPVPPPLTWGIIGTSNRVEPLTIVPGATGVVRLLSNDVRYSRPPNGVAWSEIANEPGRFEMVWPGDPTATQSLAGIATAARQAAGLEGPLPSGHPAAARLDEAVFALFATVDRLQSQGWGIGLLTPTNIILDSDNGQTTATLVDLGFTWIGDFGDPPWDASPGRPEWLEPSAGMNPAALAWDRPPAEQQFAQPSGGLFVPAPEHDLRTLARIVGWALTGSPIREIPPHGSHAPVWAVLSDMMAGKYPTAGHALRELRASPPSSQFAAPPKLIELVRDEPVRKRSRMPMIGGMAGLLGILAVGGYILLGGSAAVVPTPPTGPEVAVAPDTSPTPATEPTLSPSTTGTMAEVETDYAQIPKEKLADRITKFRDVTGAAKAPEAVARAGKYRIQLFADWIDTCEVHATDTDPARRSEAGANLRKLVDAYFQLNQDYPPTDPKLRAQEQQWLEQYDRQAELLGWPR